MCFSCVLAQEEYMASIAITRTLDATERRALARKEKSGRVAARLLAIANVLSGMSRGCPHVWAGWIARRYVTGCIGSTPKV